MPLNCPKCHHAGLLVAAMNLKETQQTDIKGDFTGGGIGVRTGGLGILGGGGTYAETDEMYTKRAKIFTSPEVVIEPVMNKFFRAIATFVIFTIGLPFIQHLAGQEKEISDPISFALHNILFNPTLAYLFPMMVIILSIIFFTLGIKEVEENEKLEEEIPKILARYREIFYCENCNFLFDDRGNLRDGSKLGFDAMMEIPAKQEILNFFEVH